MECRSYGRIGIPSLLARTNCGTPYGRDSEGTKGAAGVTKKQKKLRAKEDPRMGPKQTKNKGRAGRHDALLETNKKIKGGYGGLYEAPTRSPI